MSSQSQSASLPDPNHDELFFIINNEEDFNEFVLKRQQLVLLEFYLPCVDACQTLRPLLEETVKKYSGHVVMAQVDSDANRYLLPRCEVDGFPTIIFMQGGEVLGDMNYFITEKISA